jgi:micrococcal nuclease
MPRRSASIATLRLPRSPRSRLAVLVTLVVLILAACESAQNTTADTTSIDAQQTISATVVDVTDGDTIKVSYQGREDRVRLIGIDTPETHGRAGLRECFGQQASDRLGELLPVGTAITLTTDVEPRDRYDRLLAYVYRDSDRLFVNLAQVRDGYAAAYAYPPNTTYVSDFSEAAGDAKRRDLGLWGECGGPDAPLPRAS